MRAIFVVLMLVLISCEVEETNIYDIKDIVGKWDWQRTTGGVGEKYLRKFPERKETLILRSDHTYEISINGKLLHNGTYVLNLEKSFALGKETNILRFRTENGTLIRSVYLVKGNSLMLQDDVADGFTHEYMKL